MRVLLKVISLSMLLVIFTGICVAAFSIAGAYMVGSGQVLPGEPMYLDQLAPELGGAMIDIFIGVVLLFVGFGVRALVQRALSASPHNTSVNMDAPKAARPLP